MNKVDIIRLVSIDTGVSKSVVEAVLTSFTGITAEAMVQGDKVMISGFGVFEPKVRNARTGRNINTSEWVEIPARAIPSFRPSKLLIDRVSGGDICEQE